MDIKQVLSSLMSGNSDDRDERRLLGERQGWVGRRCCNLRTRSSAHSLCAWLAFCAHSQVRCHELGHELLRKSRTGKCKPGSGNIRTLVLLLIRPRASRPQKPRASCTLRSARTLPFELRPVAQYRLIKKYCLTSFIRRSEETPKQRRPAGQNKKKQTKTIAVPLLCKIN